MTANITTPAGRRFRLDYEVAQLVQMISFGERPWSCIDVDVERVKISGSVDGLLSDCLDGVDDCGNGYLTLWYDYVLAVETQAKMEVF